MRPSIRRLLAALVFAIALAPVLGAQAGGPRFALVIGNGSYVELGKLKNPANDATDMAQALAELGFKVKLLVDADLPAMEDAVVRLGNDLARQADSVGFFFYAGHGVQAGGTNYLIPADARIASETFLKNKALSGQSVLDTLQDSRNALNIVVLDACRDNPFSWSRSGTRGLTVVGNQPTGSIVAYATSAGSVAQDGTGRNGVFTAELLTQLRTPGLEIKDVFNRTGKGVSTATAGKQVPAVYNQFFDSVYLAGLKTEPKAGPKAEGQSSAEASPPPAASATSPTATAIMAPAAAPTLTVTRSYGSLVIVAASPGNLYLDGKPLGELPAGAEAKLDTVEVGERVLELRYATGDSETKSVAVQKGQSAAVSFIWKKPVPAPQPPAGTALASGGFVRVPAGSFTMGSPASEKGRSADEGPQHEVKLSAFAIGRYEVTQGEWQAVMGSNPSSFKGDDRLPVEKLSWYDTIVYCNTRSIKVGLTPCYNISGSTDPSRWDAEPTSTNSSWKELKCDFYAIGYRLPTEAEWEYACRAGTRTATSFGDTLVSSQANFAGNSPNDWTDRFGRKTAPVGSYPANAWGIYDMHGNVLEWCWDWYGTYSSASQADPMGASSGTYRVERGGSYSDIGYALRSANRDRSNPNLLAHGFRVVVGR